MVKKIIFSIIVILFLFAFFMGLNMQPVKLETLPVESIALNEEYVVMDLGTTEVLLASVYPYNANNQKILWSSSNPSVVEVDNGIIKAKSAGNAQIFVMSDEGGFTDYCYVDVINY